MVDPRGEPDPQRDEAERAANDPGGDHPDAGGDAAAPTPTVIGISGSSGQVPAMGGVIGADEEVRTFDDAVVPGDDDEGRDPDEWRVPREDKG